MESHPHKEWIDLYRENGQLQQLNSAEPFPELDGLEAVDDTVPASLIIEWLSYDVRREEEIQDVALKVTLQVGLKTCDLPIKTQEAIWEMFVAEM